MDNNNMKYIQTDNLTAILYKDGGKKLQIFNCHKSEYGYNSRDLITSFFGVSDKEFTYKYVENKVDEVYSTFNKQEIDELLNKINNYESKQRNNNTYNKCNIYNNTNSISNMKLTNEEKDEITWRVVDSLYEKLANELEYELQEHENFPETNDAYMDLFNEMTIKIVKYMRSELFQPMTNEDLK